MISSRIPKMSCRYSYVRELGSGSYGEVIEVEDEKGEVSAYKKYLSIVKMLDSLPEIDIESRIRSTYLIKMKDLIFNECLDSENGAIVIQKFDGDLLELRQKPFIDKENYVNTLIECFHSIVNATKCLHLNGYYHRDIKIENVFYSFSYGKYSFVLGDYGLALPVDTSTVKVNSAEGSAGITIPPEVFEKRELNSKSDCWGIGITLYEFITREDISKTFDISSAISFYHSPVFNPERLRRRMLEKVERSTPNYDDYVQLVELIVKCITPNSEKRIGLEEILENKIFENLENGNCTYISHSKFGEVDLSSAIKELKEYLPTVSKNFFLRSLFVGWYNYLLHQRSGVKLKYFVLLSKVLFSEERASNLSESDQQYLASLVKMMNGKIYHSFYRTHPRDYVSLASSLLLLLQGKRVEYLTFLTTGRLERYPLQDRRRTVFDLLQDIRGYLK